MVSILKLAVAVAPARGLAVSHMEQTGLNALPIVGLITFLMGMVLAYLGAAQLARFGAQIFTVNVVAIGVLREMGILLTAIIVAGRSGSAFTAQIGTMKVTRRSMPCRPSASIPWTFWSSPGCWRSAWCSPC